MEAFDFSALKKRHNTVPSSALADLVADWLSNTAEQDSTIWVWTEDIDAGLDLTLHIYRRFNTGFGALDIPHDTLPTRVEHPRTGNAVYVISQPDHIDPVVTSMNAGSQGTVELHGPDGRVKDVQDKSEEEEIESVKFQAESEELITQMPAGIILDTEAPRWQYLTDFLNGETAVLETEKVHKDKGLQAEIDRQLSRLE